MAIIGSARCDERGHITGGAVGDQKQRSTPDYNGEVSLQQFYLHRKGWYILRPKKAEHANKIAKKMLTACNNPNLGYDQKGRYGVISCGVASSVKTECDCSSLVRACVKEATGKDPGDFSTSGECGALEATGLFEKHKAYSGGTTLYTGDVLVTQSRGHTVIVVEGAKRSAPTANTETGTKSLEQIAEEVIAGKWGTGDERRQRLAAAGYSYAKVQEAVNKKLSAKTKKSVTEVAKEVILGKWGNGDARRQKLKAHGYDPDEVQKAVNKLS